MLGLLLQGVVLIGIIAWLSDDDFSSYEFSDYLKAGLLAAGTSALSFALTLGLVGLLPVMHAAVTAICLSAIALGFAIAFFYGVEVPKALMGSGVYFLVGLIINFGLSGFYA